MKLFARPNLLLNPSPLSHGFNLSKRLYELIQTPLLPHSLNMSFSLSVSPQCQALPSRPLPSEKKRGISVKSFAGASTGTASRPRGSTLYEVLGVKNDASVVEIKRAYRSLAKLHHPDSVRQSSSDGHDHDFVEIHNAYATLSDPSARSAYDLSLELQRRQRLRISVENRSGFYRSRSWETDQCW